MFEALISSIFAFISTNIDDILILMFIFTANTGVKTHKIITGKYIGMGVLTLVSILSAMGLRLIDERFIPFLGFIPIFLGIKEIISALKEDKDNDPIDTKGGILSTAFITIASGADNIGVYIPLFTGFGAAETTLAILVFAVMTLLWCFLGKSLASLTKIKEFIEKYKSVLIPTVYLLLGIYIFFK